MSETNTHFSGAEQRIKRKYMNNFVKKVQDFYTYAYILKIKTKKYLHIK